MPDKYSITELLPTHTCDEVSARITFADPALLTELAGGAAIFQTLKNHWRLSINTIPHGGEFKFIFNLHCTARPASFRAAGGDAPLKSAGSLRWTLGTVQSPTEESGTQKFDLAPLKEGARDEVLCTFQSGSWQGANIATRTKGVISLSLKMTLPENYFQYERWKEIHFTTWANTSYTFGSQLLDPASGDVILLVGATNLQQRLYAYKSVLARNSEYFASSLKPEWRAGKQAGKKSKTVPLHTEDIPASSSDTSDSREGIYFTAPKDDIDFVTLHNILYFIYIGRVNLPFVEVEADSEPLPDGYPQEGDPFRLFRAADKFLLPILKERCFLHLEHGVTTKNVVERLFHPDCEHHGELRQHYFDYLVANFDVVKQTEEWESVICPSEEVSSSVSSYRNRLLLEITKRLRKYVRKMSLEIKLSYHCWYY